MTRRRDSDIVTGGLLALIIGLITWATITDNSDPVPSTPEPEMIPVTAPTTTIPAQLPPLAAEVLEIEDGKTWTLGLVELAALHRACWPDEWAGVPLPAEMEAYADRAPCIVVDPPADGPTFDELRRALDR
jgi:hypothetical protein